MNIYRCKVGFDIVIRAESEKSAYSMAESVVKDSDDPASEVEVSQIKNVSELPEGWDKNCIPWRIRDAKDTTIGEILGV